MYKVGEWVQCKLDSGMWSEPFQYSMLNNLQPRDTIRRFNKGA